jgi:hypothetical protein
MGAGAAVAGAAAVPLAAAYGIGKLIAPKQTDAAADAVAGWFNSKATPLIKKAEAVGSGYETGMAEAIPGSRFLEKALPKEAQNTIQQVKAQNPAATTAGKVAGNVGLMAIPGLNVFQGATTGGKIAALAGNAALTMSPFAIGAGLNELADSGDPAAAIKKAAIAEALGVAGGTAIGGAGLLFGKLAKAAHPILNEVDAASYGIVGRDVSKPGAEFARKMGLNPTGYKAGHGDENLDKIMTLLRSEGGRSKAGLQKAEDWVNGSYDSINGIMKDSGATLSGKLPDILQAPIVQTLKGKFDPKDVDNVIKMLTTEADKYMSAGPRGWSDARGYLNDMMQAGIASGKGNSGISIGENAGDNITKMIQKTSEKHGAGELLQDSASVVKAHMNEMTHNVLNEARQAGQAVPDLESLDHIYSAYPSLQQSLARRAGKPMGSMAGGSESTAGLASMSGIGGMIGGPAGAVASKVLGATAMAPLLKRGVGYATNQVMGRTAAGLDKLLSNASGAVGNAPSAVSPIIGGMVTGNGENGGLLSSIDGPTMASGPAMGQAAPPEQAPAGAPSTIPMQPIPNAPAQPPQPTPAQAMSNANDAMVHAADPARNVPGFNPTAMQERLQEWYQIHTRRMGNDLSFDDFTNQLKQATGGFSADNPLTYKIMVDDPSEAERIFKAHMTMKKLDGVHLEDALNYYTHPLHRIGGTRFSSDVGRTEDMAHTQLVDALHGMGLGDSKEIEGRLKKIAWDPKMKDKDKLSAVTDWIANQGGIPIQQLMDLGLWH